MNTILVINGSPKGKNSITLHTCLFLEKKFPGYQYGQNLFLTPVVFSLERWRLFLIRLLAVVGLPLALGDLHVRENGREGGFFR